MHRLDPTQVLDNFPFCDNPENIDQYPITFQVSSIIKNGPGQIFQTLGRFKKETILGVLTLLTVLGLLCYSHHSRDEGPTRGLKVAAIANGRFLSGALCHVMSRSIWCDLSQVTDGNFHFSMWFCLKQARRKSGNLIRNNPK